jgi:hypothetical protein
MPVRGRANLAVALVFAGLAAAAFGCQGEDAQGGRTSGSTGVTVQVGDGVVDGSPEAATGEPTALLVGIYTDLKRIVSLRPGLVVLAGIEVNAVMARTAEERKGSGNLGLKGPTGDTASSTRFGGTQGSR